MYRAAVASRLEDRLGIKAQRGTHPLIHGSSRNPDAPACCVYGPAIWGPAESSSGLRSVEETCYVKAARRN